MTDSSTRQRFMRNHSIFSLAMLTGILLVVCASLLTAPSFATQAQGSATATPSRSITGADVNAAAANLYCPVCENVPLNVCYTAACEDWKQQVRDLLAQGYTQAQVETYFAERFGRKTVGTPRSALEQGLTIGLPFALIAGLGVMALISIVGWRRARPVPPSESMLVNEAANNAANGSDSTTGAITADYRARIEAEVREE